MIQYDLQIATYLCGRGWRVIAGCRQGGLGARLAGSWLQAHAAATPENQPPPRLATLELDVAREDLLEEAARATAQHLPAGEHGNIFFLFGNKCILNIYVYTNDNKYKEKS